MEDDITNFFTRLLRSAGRPIKRPAHAEDLWRRPPPWFLKPPGGRSRPSHVFYLDDTLRGRQTHTRRGVRHVSPETFEWLRQFGHLDGDCLRAHPLDREIVELCRALSLYPLVLVSSCAGHDIWPLEVSFYLPDGTEFFDVGTADQPKHYTIEGRDFWCGTMDSTDHPRPALTFGLYSVALGAPAYSAAVVLARTLHGLIASVDTTRP